MCRGEIFPVQSFNGGKVFEGSYRYPNFLQTIPYRIVPKQSRSARPFREDTDL